MHRFLAIVSLILGAAVMVRCSSKEYYREQPAMNLALDPRPPLPKEEPIPEIPHIDPKLAFFNFDKADLRGDAKRALRPTAEWLRKHSEVHLQIEGFCDEKGSVEYNLELGQRRADAAKEFFVEYGIDPERILTLSYGRVIGASDKERANNRRVGFVVIYPEDKMPK